MDHVFNISYEGKPRGVMVSIIVSSPYSEHNSPEERRAFLEVITKAVRTTFPIIEFAVREAVEG